MRLSLSNKKFRGMDLIFKALTCLSGTFLSFTPLTWMKYRVLSSSMAFSHLSVSASIVTAYIASLSLYLSFCHFQERCFLAARHTPACPKVYQYIFFCNGVGVYFLFLRYAGMLVAALLPWLCLSALHNIFFFIRALIRSDAALLFAVAGSGLVMERRSIRPLLGNFCCAY